jgi:hypothetical protein
VKFQGKSVPFWAGFYREKFNATALTAQLHPGQKKSQPSAIARGWHGFILREWFMS